MRLGLDVIIDKFNDSITLSVENLQNAACVNELTEAKAKASLKERILKSLRLYDNIEKNWERGVIGCKDGTVLIVRFQYDAWGYDIAGPDRAFFSSSSSNHKKFDDEVRAALNHAEQSYGGVAWAIPARIKDL